MPSEGCKVDLSDAKAYYSRHKVCGMHSKSPKVIVSGLEQRFCQQCSRFHQLPEFDEGKRSCRRRLAGHNERRRKPTRGTLLSPRYGTLYPSLFDNCGKSTGGFVMDFSSYPAHSGTDSWPNLTSQQNPYSQNPPSNHLLQGYTTNVSSQECNFTSALSLLSNQPWASRTHSSTLGAHNGSTIGQYPGSSWGLGQTLNHANSQYNGELGLTQPNEGHFQELDRSSVYDSSIQNMHWTL